jgi:hypothetical protein
MEGRLKSLNLKADYIKDSVEENIVFNLDSGAEVSLINEKELQQLPTEIYKNIECRICAPRCARYDHSPNAPSS